MRGRRASGRRFPTSSTACWSRSTTSTLISSARGQRERPSFPSRRTAPMDGATASRTSRGTAGCSWRKPATGDRTQSQEDRSAQPAPAAQVRGRAWRCRGIQPAAREGQADRARAHRAPGRPQLVRGARHLRHPSRRGSGHGCQARARRRRGDRDGEDRRPRRDALQPRRFGVRRLARRGLRREGHQGDGPCHAQPHPDHRHQRLWRRPHPGGRGLACRLRGDLLAQRRVERGDPAAEPDPRSVHRRRRVLARDDRLHLHGSRRRATCSSPGPR